MKWAFIIVFPLCSLWSLCLVFPSNLRHFTNYRFDAIALGAPADQIEGQRVKCYNRRNP